MPHSAEICFYNSFPVGVEIIHPTKMLSVCSKLEAPFAGNRAKQL